MTLAAEPGAEPARGDAAGGPALADWLTAACAELGLGPGEVDAGLLLSLAREVAHRVARPGAPITAYLLGLAVGRGADPAEAAARLSRLARGWPAAD